MRILLVEDQVILQTTTLRHLAYFTTPENIDLAICADQATNLIKKIDEQNKQIDELNKKIDEINPKIAKMNQKYYKEKNTTKTIAQFKKIERIEKYAVVIMDQNLASFDKNKLPKEISIEKMDKTKNTGQHVVDFIRDAEKSHPENEKTIIITCSTEQDLLGVCDLNGKFKENISQEKAKKDKETNKNSLCHNNADGRVNKPATHVNLYSIFKQYPSLQHLVKSYNPAAKQSKSIKRSQSVLVGSRSPSLPDAVESKSLPMQPSVSNSGSLFSNSLGTPSTSSSSSDNNFSKHSDTKNTSPNK